MDGMSETLFILLSCPARLLAMREDVLTFLRETLKLEGEPTE